MPVATSIVMDVVSFAWSRAVSLRAGALSVRPEMKHVISKGYRRSRESGVQGNRSNPSGPWVPAFAGKTIKLLILRASFLVSL